MIHHIYIYIYIWFGLQKNMSFCVLCIIRIYPVDIYPICYHTHMCGYRAVCPRLNNFVRTLKRCFLFKHRFSSCNDLIYNSVILINNLRVFVDDVFSYLSLFVLTYIPPIWYVRNWKDHVSPKNQLYWDFTLNVMVCRT